LLRVGYYKLTQPHTHADDWVWLVDHTAQLGAAKCLVILGVRLSALPADDYCLRHEQVEPLALFPVTQSNGKVVFQQLEQTIARTGIPREIVSDQGSDLHAGIPQFCHVHPATAPIYDIKHKTALVFKHDLQEDGAWETFCQLAAHTRSQVQQTSLAPLAFPNQGTKSRYMNTDRLIVWGERMLAFLERHRPRSPYVFAPHHVEEKYGWLRQFRQPLREWHEVLTLVSTTEEFVRTHGLSRRCHVALRQHLVVLAHTARGKKVRQQLMAFVLEASFQAKANERLVGSSAVLENPCWVASSR
jgi:hypothetical protein